MKLFFFFLSIPCIAIASDHPFSISLDSQNSIYLSAFNTSPIRRSINNETVTEIIGGKEENESECRSSFRASSADALADVKILDSDADSISIFLTSNATANGGKYRKCVLCPLDNCVGFLPDYTEGKASAVSRSIVTIRFDPDFPPSNYFINVSSSSQNSALKIHLTNSQGQRVEIRDKNGEPSVLPGGAGIIYYLSLELPAGVVHKGEFNNAEQLLSERVDIAVSKAPILSSLGELEPYIVGGEQTTAYPTVGAILLNGLIHCTGTVIGHKTVLTAAHCLNGFEKQMEKMTFVIGGNVLQPTTGPLHVKDMDYPKEASTGYFFNPKTYEDDIGLIYLETSVPIKPLSLHKGSPTWDDILKKQISLLFVGFGYDVIENQKLGKGIKREASWWINGIQNRRVTFEVPGKNTCKGDSGGPAFLIVEGKLVQVAVTSGGSMDCTSGYDTRLDAYEAWLNGKVH